MPRFNANLSMMFNEVPFLDRFAAAAKAGFSAVEFLFPYDFPKEQVKEALDRAKLPERDVPLLNATVQLALDGRKPFSSGSAAAADKPPATPARLDLASSTATLARARRQLGELELLTKDRRP